MDINKIIFSRTSAPKKAEIIKGLYTNELLSVTPATIKRIVKETGTRLYKSRDKQLLISHERLPGNNWNSFFEGVLLRKGQLTVSLYLQYENTDTNTDVTLESFFARGDFHGSVVRDDRQGNPRHYYFTYTESDKAGCIRNMLLEYLHRKYKDKGQV